MPTHQEIGGMSDEDLLQRLVTSHAERYGEAFWAFSMRGGEALTAAASGNGPGLRSRLFLRDSAGAIPSGPARL